MARISSGVFIQTRILRDSRHSAAVSTRLTAPQNRAEKAMLCRIPSSFLRPN